MRTTPLEKLFTFDKENATRNTNKKKEGCPRTHLYAKSNVCDVEVDGDNGAEHDEAAQRVLHEGQAAAPVTRSA